MEETVEVKRNHLSVLAMHYLRTTPSTERARKDTLWSYSGGQSPGEQTSREAIFISRLFKAMTLQLNEPLIIKCDNTQTLQLITEDTAKLITKLRHVGIYRVIDTGYVRNTQWDEYDFNGQRRRRWSPMDLQRPCLSRGFKASLIWSEWWILRSGWIRRSKWRT